VNSSMACVVPGWKLNKLINQGDLVKARKAAEEQHNEEHREGAVMESRDSTEYDRFESLAREIVKVPKEELDRRRDETTRDR